MQLDFPLFSAFLSYFFYCWFCFVSFHFLKAFGCKLKTVNESIKNDQHKKKRWVRIHCTLNILTNKKNTEELYATADHCKLFCILTVNTTASIYMTVLGSCKIDFRLSLVQGVAFHIFHWNYYYFLVLLENFIPLHIQFLQENVSNLRNVQQS